MSRSADLRDHLNSLFHEHREKNARFSLRAFAKKLQIPISTLSKLIRKEIPLSEKRLLQLAAVLDLSKKDIDHYRRGIKSKRKDPEALRPIRSLSITDEEFIENWEYSAVIECSHLTPSCSLADLSYRLGLDLAEIKKIVNYLVEKKYVEFESSTGLLKPAPTHLTTLPIKDITLAQTNYQKNFHLRAIDAITKLNHQQRNNTSIMIAADEDLLPILVDKIKLFRRELAEYIDANSTNKNSVLEIGFSVMTVTKSSPEATPK